MKTFNVWILAFVWRTLNWQISSENPFGFSADLTDIPIGNWNTRKQIRIDKLYLQMLFPLLLFMFRAKGSNIMFWQNILFGGFTYGEGSLWILYFMWTKVSLNKYLYRAGRTHSVCTIACLGISSIWFPKRFTRHYTNILSFFDSSFQLFSLSFAGCLFSLCDTGNCCLLTICAT